MTTTREPRASTQRDNLRSNHTDDMQTPGAAILPLLPYLPKDWTP